ncbi:hypothetical protein [Sinisalibacter aestuarii]|uniref:DsrE family protein n=1 Tax=Sinisalibacter aestuarii TaxID=2949426 RepID=A0ABQ5LV12_9RHOB|nr:hypothetical protein [Sinisalibacter aestuarii]GKY88428.1 hypothetical protein STA1M1_22970 [Sinisalibacter aestuarii]
MDVLLHITTPNAAPVAAALGWALTAEGASWGCFLTNDGVKALGEAEFSTAIDGAARVAVCEHSWDLHMAGADCPVERGSQTVNSALMAEAARVVSL